MGTISRDTTLPWEARFPEGVGSSVRGEGAAAVTRVLDGLGNLAANQREEFTSMVTSWDHVLAKRASQGASEAYGVLGLSLGWSPLPCRIELLLSANGTSGHPRISLQPRVNPSAQS